MRTTLQLCAVFLLSTLLAACGGGSSGGGGGGGGGGGAIPVPTALTGVFLDSPVINIGYRTETLEGVTNDLGEYDYIPGETVTFFIGDLEFPPVLAVGIVTPLDLADSQDTSDPEVVNMIRLLQTLDQDGNPANGITITETAISNATQVDFSLSVAEFEVDMAVTTLILNAGQDSPVVALVDESVAVAHFEGQLDVINGVDVSLVGTWSAVDNSADLLEIVFFDDGNYVHAEIFLGGVEQENGMEWGTYSRDATNGRVTATQIFDSNDDVGLTDFVDGSVAPFLFIAVSGDQLTGTVDEDGNGTIDGTFIFQRAASAGILGTWRNTSTENEFLMLQFFDDGTYVHAEVDLDPNPNEEISGMEWGNYFHDAGTGRLTTTPIFDENGTTGLSGLVPGPGPPFLFLDVVGDVTHHKYRRRWCGRCRVYA